MNILITLKMWKENIYWNFCNIFNFSAYVVGTTAFRQGGGAAAAAVFAAAGAGAGAGAIELEVNTHTWVKICYLYRGWVFSKYKIVKEVVTDRVPEEEEAEAPPPSYERPRPKSRRYILFKRS